MADYLDHVKEVKEGNVAKSVDSESGRWLRKRKLIERVVSLGRRRGTWSIGREKTVCS